MKAIRGFRDDRKASRCGCRDETRVLTATHVLYGSVLFLAADKVLHALLHDPIDRRARTRTRPRRPAIASGRHRVARRRLIQLTRR
jgi:hypothetical protein